MVFSFPLFRLQKIKKASLIADVMVSIFILSVGITASATIIMNSLQQNAINKNRIIALNLAREGIEAVRILRDTNWLRYGESARICWNFWANTNQDVTMNDNDEPCQESTTNPGQNSHPIGLVQNSDGSFTKIKSYLALLDPETFEWMLVENFYIQQSDGTFIPTYQDRGIGQEDFTYEEGKTGENRDEDYWTNRKTLVNATIIGTQEAEASRLYIDTETGLYTHHAQGNTASHFFREIFIRYPVVPNSDAPESSNFVPLATDTGDTGGGNAKVLDNQISIESKVWFMGLGGKMQSLSLETEITDYLNRNNWYD